MIRRVIGKIALPLVAGLLFAVGLAACAAPDLPPAAPRSNAPLTPERIIVTVVVVATPTAGAAHASDESVNLGQSVQESAATLATPAPDAAPEGPDTIEARRIAVYQQAAPAVVNVTTQVLLSNFFWGDVPQEGSGSGFLWDTEGHIVTNNHVVSGAQSIEVSFSGDQSVPARLVGTDPINDLAVLMVDKVPSGVKPLRLGSSAGLRVGQSAIAIGNPFGQFERTLTVGVISALNRTLETDTTVLRGVIQTDAAINRGNSGGPLLDSGGRLIGVDTAIYSPTGTSAGVGLAIPVDKVRKVVPVLIKDGRYPHPWLGVEQLGYEISPVLARALGLPVDHGLLIARLYSNGPADRAQLRGAQQEMVFGNRRYLVGGDIITAIDGQKVDAWTKLTGYLEENAQVGQKVSLTIVRNGQVIQVQATLDDMPESLRPG
jgi:S1-C subfamily serine protease